MSTLESTTWAWTAAEPPQIGFAWVAADGGVWEPASLPQLEVRDLEVAKASSGALGVTHARAAAGAGTATGWHRHDLAFELLYVLQGSVTVETARGDSVELAEGATMQCGHGCWRNLTGMTADFECLQVTAPAAAVPVTGDGPPETERSVPSFTVDTDEAYVTGAGPRTFFRYRDLGTAEPTEGRLHVHVVRATAPGAGTGWHYHTMAQWFLVLSGRGHIRFEDHPDQPLRRLDAMCLGRGPSMRHNVGPIDAEYGVIEICVPAEYETIAVPRPEEGAEAPAGGVDE